MMTYKELKSTIQSCDSRDIRHPLIELIDKIENMEMLLGKVQQKSVTLKRESKEKKNA